MPPGQILRATLLLAALAAPAGAQAPVTQGLIPDGAPRPAVLPSSDPAETLARYLRVLATDPRNLEALTGAGYAALQIGDANAALAFYARAEEISPRNGRIKAGLGSALLQLQKPREAIRLFDDAVDLGVPEADVASDRGLALDLRGDNKRAQKSYAVALGAFGDDETKRRMALSMAITGDGDGATQLLDPLLRRNDRGAWRARAFILAIGGDVAGAEVVARSAMSAAQVAALRPFLARLASLKPAQKALAVNFGEMPADGRTYARSDLAALEGATPPSPRRAPLGNGLIPDGEPFGPLPSTSASPLPVSPVRVSAAPRRRPGAADVASVDTSARGGSLLSAKPAPAPPPVAPIVPVVAKPAERSVPPPVVTKPVAATPTETKPVVPAAAPVAAKPVPADVFTLDPSITARARAESASIKAEKPAPEEAAAIVDAKSNKPKTSPTAVADTEQRKPAKPKTEPEPARIWVQVAGGASTADLPRTWARLKPKAPPLAKDQDVWTTPLRATNRLLVGPFKNDDEAQAYVNRMSKAGLSGFTFTSEKGQEIAKLPTAKK